MRIQIIQSLINKIRRKAPKNSHIKELGQKIISYEKIKDNIDTIILGSSHAQLGYRAKDNEFNLGLSFQDLYCSYNLYKKYNNPRIKNIILFYSVFSPGSQTIKSKFANTMTVYKIIVGFDYQDKDTAKEKELYKLEYDYKRQYKKFKKNFMFDKNYRGNEVSYITCFKPPIAADRAAPHYKNNTRKNHQTNYVIRMKNIADTNKAKFLVVIPPASEAYKKSLPTSAILFSELFKAEKENNVEILNMYDSEIFNDSDFEDWDHLNIIGAEKLTTQINNYIKNLDI